VNKIEVLEKVFKSAWVPQMKVPWKFAIFGALL
jgi:hypothetical protein